MDNQALLITKLILRDMNLMEQTPNEFKTEKQMLQYMGMGMALRHCYTAMSGRTFDSAKMTVKNLQQWANDLPMPEGIKDKYHPGEISGRLI